ncbi:EF-P 5-aminopentanol modification-associated protein YfmF [Bacillus sp. S10(2024)]|uniref:EF-P 5-aminopentanol modification-associated protein YfmF n=1 Tax=Bacillus sp. S10(2024) TaxID=3162886 RepID=UPI003D223058
MVKDFTQFRIEPGFDTYISQPILSKTISVYLFNISKLNKNHTSIYSLIPNILSRGTSMYQTSYELNQKFAELYGLRFDSTAMKRGDFLVNRFRMVFPDQKYIQSNPNLLEETLKLMYEIINRPFLEDGEFLEEYIEQAKNNQLILLKNLKDNRFPYALSKFDAHLCANEPFAINALGSEEEIKSINKESIFHYYNQMLTNNTLLFVRGNVEHDQVLKDVENNFLLNRNENVDALPVTHLFPHSQSLKEVVEISGSGQSILIIGGRLGINRKHKEWIALETALFILGGYPQSTLFKKVRDEQGLAYTVLCYPNSIKGIFNIIVGIDEKNLQQTKQVILEELYKIRDGQISEKEFQNAKQMLLQQYITVLENATEHIETYLNGILAGGILSVQERIHILQNVSIHDVKRAAQRIQPELIYFLKGE